MSPKDIPDMTPEEAAEAHDITIEALREYGLRFYVQGRETRTAEGFDALWSKWARGKTRMPLAVESALDPNVRALLDTPLVRDLGRRRQA